VTSLTELREAGKRATPGPWKQDGPNLDLVVQDGASGREPMVAATDPDDRERGRDDAALIALMRNNWDALLDVVEAAQGFETAEQVGEPWQSAECRRALFGALARLRDTQDTTA
jgi:hypothetical protein